MGLDGDPPRDAITADAPGDVDFWVRVLGLRLVKKTVNFDAPDMYHLYFGDETGSPGSLLTFFEIPGAPPGARRRRHDPPASCGGCPRRPSLDVLGGAAGRRGAAGAAWRRGAACRPIRRAWGWSWWWPRRPTAAPRAAWAPDIPAEHALAGIAGVRIHSQAPEATERAPRGRPRIRRRGPGPVRDPRRRAPRLPLARCRAGRARRPGAGRCTTWPGRRATRTTPTGAARGAGGRRPDAGDRPPVLPLDLLPRARRGAVRDRDRQPGVRGGRGAGPSWARSCACRRSTRPTASASRSGSRP